MRFSHVSKPRPISRVFVTFRSSILIWPRFCARNRISLKRRRSAGSKVDRAVPCSMLKSGGGAALITIARGAADPPSNRLDALSQSVDKGRDLLNHLRLVALLCDKIDNRTAHHDRVGVLGDFARLLGI